MSEAAPTPEEFLASAKESLVSKAVSSTEIFATNRSIIQEILYALEDILNMYKYNQAPEALAKSGADIIRLESRITIIRSLLKDDRVL